MKKKINSRLRVLLAEHGVSQIDVAQKTGISYTAINRLFHNKARMVSLDTLETLCNYFDCQITDILDLK